MRRPPGLRLAVAALAVVAACSGDDGGGADDDGAAEDGASATSTSTSIVFTGDPGSSFCTQLRDARLEVDLDEDSATPAEVEAAFTAVLEALGTVVEQSPPELAEDTALVLAGMVALDDALRAVGYSYDDLAADPARAVAVSRAANDPAFAVANARIAAYRAQVCDR